MINIRHFAPAAAFAIALGVSGCATTTPTGEVGTGGGPVVVAPPQSAEGIVAAIQKYTSLACSFVPETDFVVQILGSNIPGLQTASSVAKAICASLTSKGARRGVPPTVAGIPVRGHRTR